MWMFLATEVLFFGALFTGYTVYRSKFPAAFEEASHKLYWWLGAINTAVLLGSSLTVVLAVLAARTGQQRQLRLWIAATIVLGTAFLGIKAAEYAIDYHEGLIPGRWHPHDWPKGVDS